MRPGSRSSRWASAAATNSTTCPMSTSSTSARPTTTSAETTPIAIKLMQICAQVAWPVDAALRPEGNRGPLVRTLAEPPRLLPQVGPYLGVSGAAQGAAGGRRHRPRPRVAGRTGRTHLARVRAAGGGRRHPLDASPHRRRRSTGRGRSRDQAWTGRSARHRVRRAAVAARPRPGRRVAAPAGHDRRPRRTVRRWLRRPRRRRGVGGRLPVPADGRAPAAAATVAAHAHRPDRRAVAAVARACVGLSREGRP